MSATDVKQIRSCHVHDIGVRRLASKARLRSQHSGGEQIFVAHTVQSSELFQRFGMNLADNIDAEMETIIRCSAHASLRSVFR